jgi:tetratricopeptide (TPR) repeat protein
MAEADLSTLSSKRVDLMITCIDLSRQLGDRVRAGDLLSRVERECALSKTQAVQLVSLRLRLTRDLQGGGVARRSAQRLAKSWPDVMIETEVLNQRARIGRDTGRVSEALQLATQALATLTREGRSSRHWRTNAEILYTCGSIQRLAGLYEAARQSLEGSAAIRNEHADKQGRAYALLELAMCALVRRDQPRSSQYLAEAISLSSEPEVADGRALAFAHNIESCLALLNGDDKRAAERLDLSMEWTSTYEQGIRGRPAIIQAVLFARRGRSTEAIGLLNPLLTSGDQTVRATAALILAALSP